MNAEISRDLLRLKLAEALEATAPGLTPRDVHVPAIPGKAMAVIGVRRGGKTSFMRHRMVDRISHGAPLQSHVLIGLEDERLVGMTAADLGWMLDEYLDTYAPASDVHAPCIYLDEVQTVSGWETVVRRLVDRGGVELFVSGSSARLLSREVATSLRGRAMEVLVHPFSYREALRHAEMEPHAPWSQLKTAVRSQLSRSLREYLAAGGFPEAQRAERRDRIQLLKGYVDVMILRDVIERHGISNPTALRWVQRQLLASPGSAFSAKKLYDTLRSQGIATSKDSLYSYIDHLQDAFLIRVISMHSQSERQRMSNPRKAYPIDPGLIAIYERTGVEHHGRALETAVLLELERRGYSVEWVKTERRYDVDFLAERDGDRPMLIQVCLDTTSDSTWARETRALLDGARTHRTARLLLLTLDATPPRHELPEPIEWLPAARWFLDKDEE